VTIRLIVVDPNRGGELVTEGSFDGSEVVFGRRAGVSQFVIPDPRKEISSRHGSLVCRDGAWFVRDLGSKNGMALGDRRVPVDEDGLRVGHGDILTICGFEMQVLLDVSVTPIADLEHTRVHTDLDAWSGQLAEELEALWAESLGGTADQRADAVESRLRAGISDLMPEQARVVLARLSARWGFGGGERIDQQQEELYRAGYDAMTGLSTTLLGDASFTSAPQVHRFATLLRQCIELSGEWIARNLQARESFGEEFGAEVTMLFKRSANPLKKESDPAAMLRFLLDWRDERPVGTIRHYLSGLFEDLSEHQMGILAGVREAVDAVVDRLSPARIEAAAEQQGWSLSSKGARAWETYCKLHKDLVEERSRLLNEVVSPAICRGYLGSHEPPTGGADVSSSGDRPKTGGR
jgi:type VI secretion system protein ImpI